MSRTLFELSTNNNRASIFSGGISNSMESMGFGYAQEPSHPINNLATVDHENGHFESLKIGVMMQNV